MTIISLILKISPVANRLRKRALETLKKASHGDTVQSIILKGVLYE